MKKLTKGLLILFVLIGILVAIGYHFINFTFVEEPLLTGHFETNTITVDGIERQYYTYTPTTVSPTAIVIALHGSKNDGIAARRSFGYRFDELADQHGFIVVYPNGFENHWNDCRVAAPYSANTQNIDDVNFLRTLKATIANQHKLEQPKAYLTGISNGGHMVLRMALEAPNSFDAFVPVIANMPTPENLGCNQTQQPVSIAFMNGTADPLNPYNGGEVALYGMSKRGTVISTDASIEYWRNLANANQLESKKNLADLNTGDDSTVEVSRWSSNNGHNIALFSVKGGGHSTPHTKQRMPRVLGGTNQDVNAADLIWQFSTHQID